MLFPNKFQTFGQLFSFFNVMLTLSPYYKKAKVSFVEEKDVFLKKQRHRKAFTFRCLDSYSWFLFLSRLDIFHEDVPNGDDVADTSCQDEEVEHGVHVFLLVDTVEHGTMKMSFSISALRSCAEMPSTRMVPCCWRSNPLIR